MQYQDDNGKQNRFFFHLNTAGISFLEAVGYGEINMLRLDADQHDRERILTFNAYALKKGYELTQDFPVHQGYSFFICKKQGAASSKYIICYYSWLIDIHRITETLYKLMFSNKKDPISFEEYKEKIFEMFEFEKLFTL